MLSENGAVYPNDLRNMHETILKINSPAIVLVKGGSGNCKTVQSSFILINLEIRYESIKSD